MTDDEWQILWRQAPYRSIDQVYLDGYYHSAFQYIDHVVYKNLQFWITEHHQYQGMERYFIMGWEDGLNNNAI